MDSFRLSKDYLIFKLTPLFCFSRSNQLRHLNLPFKPNRINILSYCEIARFSMTVLLFIIYCARKITFVLHIYTVNVYIHFMFSVDSSHTNTHSKSI